MIEYHIYHNSILHNNIYFYLVCNIDLLQLLGVGGMASGSLSELGDEALFAPVNVSGGPFFVGVRSIPDGGVHQKGPPESEQ